MERNAAHVEVGQSVEVLISQPYDWKNGTQPEPVWTSGFVVTGIRSATDREYRVDVESGKRVFGACCPRCVRAEGAVA